MVLFIGPTTRFTDSSFFTRNIFDDRKFHGPCKANQNDILNCKFNVERSKTTIIVEGEERV